MADGKETKLKAQEPFPQDQFSKSKQVFPAAEEGAASLARNAPLTFFFASAADTVTPWGEGKVHVRDKQLREFWREESMLSGAIYSVCIRNAAFEWEVESESKPLREALSRMLNNAASGSNRGWVPFITQVSEDFYGTDNGAFIEIIRKETRTLKGEKAPVVGIAHLDSNRCVRTGNPKFPVLYTDRDDKTHKMPWYSVIPLCEFPSAIESMNGVGFCAVSRVLRHAQILKNLAIYKDEKVSGRFYRAIHFVGGVSRQEIEDITNRGEENADNRGQTRFIMPEIIASLDPEKPVSTATIDLASLPDGFDLDMELRWYITSLALGFGGDYQDFAPLSSGSLGSASQSEILREKSRGKGRAIFMQMLQNAFVLYGVMPTNAKFRFVAKDMAEEAEKQELRTKQSEELVILVRGGVLRPVDARQILVKRGYLDEEDVADIPDDWGDDIIAPNRQLRGPDGGSTVAEDAQRVDRRRFGRQRLRDA